MLFKIPISLSFLLFTFMSVESHPLLKRDVQPGIRYEKCASNGMVALTFDDGPASVLTEELLKVLKVAGVSATFFVVGTMVEQNPEVVLKALNDGHHIGSHTHTHANLDTLQASEIEDEVDKAAIAIENAIGKKPQYFRCPYGACTGDTLDILGAKKLKLIHWNLDTSDWQTKNATKTVDAYRAALSKADASSESFISLQHDIHASTIEAIAESIDVIKRYGFKPVDMAECLGDSELYF
ncbi:glycoside hydrolase/deacetylase [Basidiobolus meristosporus CBS 931.73]|uniref:Glycoside hydrolase/deacetylase n=1 Tax=Basidiobolus meristosporus CBS 931.73 TaxID=1314790 RepID=A0A1Y1XX98_9FUNG|nr:glycoside hydrolase/deacetylase [Basidiobolus meristosporus CBS 931.73]|eukprot:ORX90363.1 glycoside hydrolase/deacetylase [Basidiobolus meristosporus CBS 931.73]